MIAEVLYECTFFSLYDSEINATQATKDDQKAHGAVPVGLWIPQALPGDCGRDVSRGLQGWGTRLRRRSLAAAGWPGAHNDHVLLLRGGEEDGVAANCCRG